MNASKTYFAFLVLFSMVFFSFNEMPNNLKKKVEKEINSAFEVTSFELQKVVISNEVNNKMKVSIKENSLFKIFSEEKLIGYAFIDKAPSKTDEFDYLVLFDSNLIVKKTKVLIYREDYGGEIGSKRWLSQFSGKTINDTLVYEKDIIAISGATISANSMTVAINNLLQSINILHAQNII